jgi:hypothetical protein
MKMRFSVVILFLFCVQGAIFAQKNVVDFLNSNIHDAQKLTQAYLRPYGEMLGVNLNSGWYTSAGVHKLGGFDFTILATYSMVPNSGKTFDVSKMDFQYMELADPTNYKAPTMAGKMATSLLPSLKPKGYAGTDRNVVLPNGSGYEAMPSPMIQAGVGLPFKTEIMGRYVPELNYGDVGKLDLMGLGLKHNIDQHIPFLKRIPFFKMSVLGAYTQMNGNLGLAQAGMNGQSLDISSSAYTGRLLMGFNFPMVALYTGVGYGSATTSFGLKGDYEVIGANSADPYATSTVANPFAFDYVVNGVDFNAGVRLRLGIIALHADYTLGEYSAVTAGIGLSFR